MSEEEKETQPHLIPEEVKWAIVFHKKQGLKNKEIARKVSEEYLRPIGHQSVKRIWNLYSETGSVDNQWDHTGRPKALNAQECEMLVEDIHENRKDSVRERKERLNLEAGRSTINRTLVNMGYKAYKAPKKPFLDDDHKRMRLQFAQEHRNWSFEDWSRVIFSDECSFGLISSNGRIFIRRTEDEAYEEDTWQAHQGQGDTLLVWGAISITGPGPLTQIHGRVNATAYLDLFRYRLRHYYPNLYGGNMLFQQDGASVHTAEITTEWFRGKNIRLTGWPPRSPDLSIIENVWAYIKYQLKGIVFQDVDVLWQTVEMIWKKKIPEDYILSLYESLPNRIEAIIDAHGDNTKY